MRLLSVLLLVCVARVSLCRPEGELLPLDATCDEWDETCANNLARQNFGNGSGDDGQAHDDDTDHGVGNDMGDMEHDMDDDMVDTEHGMGEGIGDMAGTDKGGMDQMEAMGGVVMDEIDIMDAMGEMEMDNLDEMGDKLSMGDMDDDDDDGDGMVDDDGEVETIRVDEDEDDDEEDDDEEDFTTTTDSSSSPSSPTGPPKSRVARSAQKEDPNTQTTDTHTDSTSDTQPPTESVSTEPTDAPDPTGPPVVHLARQGPKGISLRRPSYGPHPTPLRKPNLIGLVGFTLRGANNTRTRGRVSFKRVLSNLGGGWKTTNTFRCPLYGAYYFTVHAVSTRNSGFKLALAVNFKPVVFAYASRGYRTGSVSAVFRLKPGNRVSLELLEGALYEPKDGMAHTVLTGIIVTVDLRAQRKDEGYGVRFYS